MEIEALSVSINQQILIANKLHPIVDDTANIYTASFNFDDEWDGFAKFVIFQNGSDIDFAILDDADKCQIRSRVIHSGTLYIGVQGYKDGKVLTTKEADGIKISNSGGTISLVPEPFEPSEYQKLMDRLAEVQEFVGDMEALMEQMQQDVSDRANEVAANTKIVSGAAKEVANAETVVLQSEENVKRLAAETAENTAEAERMAASAEESEREAAKSKDAAELAEKNAAEKSVEAKNSETAARKSAAESLLSATETKELKDSVEQMHENVTLMSQDVEQKALEVSDHTLIAEQAALSAAASEEEAGNHAANALASEKEAEKQAIAADKSKEEAEHQAGIAAEKASEAERQAGIATEKAKELSDTVEQVAQNKNAITKAEMEINNLSGRFGGMEDIMLPALVEHYGMDATFKMYIESMQDYVPLADLCDKFFSALAKSHDKTYTSEFWRFEVNNSGTGWKLDDNTDLVCEPSTNDVAGRDDYAALPLFACYDVNYTIDAETLEPVIHAIRGIHDSFTLHPEDSFVGVMQMTGWIRRTMDEQKKKVEYTSIDSGQGWNPLPESVRARDNSVRGYVIHAKYTAGLNAAGLLTSASGLIPASNKSYTHGHAIISHDGQISLWRKWGNQYGGSSIVDLEFLQLMMEIKYAELGNDAKMKGCQNYYLNKTVAIAEENTTRAILTASDAGSFVVGSCVSIGTSDNRGAASYDICKTAKILSIEDIEIDGTAYKALVLDVAEPFTTTTTSKVVTQPWMTGATDAVLGNDGSPINNMSDKEPYKMQGIEIQLGLYEVLGDTITYEDTEKYNVYVNRLASNYKAGGSGVDPVLIGMIPKEEAAGWKYNAELSWMAEHPEGYLLAQTFGDSSSTGYRAGTYRDAAATTGWREWRALGYLGSGARCGLSSADLRYGLSVSDWVVGCRACGTAGNRGEFMREAA